MGFCTYYINENGKYGPVVHDKWEVWSDFPWENHQSYKMQIYRIVTKHWNLFDKLQKRPVRFLVALNTLDKFFGRHAQVEDVSTRFGSVMCSL